MLVLVINCGGATFKYSLFNMDNESILAKGHVDRLRSPQSIFTHQVTGKEAKVREIPNLDHESAIQLALETLIEPRAGVLDSMNKIDAIGHKIAHGGEKYTEPTYINDEVYTEIKHFAEVTPVHNIPNLKAIDIFRKLVPNIPQIAVFETHFHTTIPQYKWMYGVPYEWYEKYRIRSYGFHSCSHRYVNERAGQLLQPVISPFRVISCHLGSGTSIAATKDGKSVDISSGFTPQSGTMMSTRPGDLDSWAILYVMQKENLTPSAMNEILTKQGGILGISGISGDMRDIEQAAAQGSKRAQLAFDAFVYRIKKFIGAYFVMLGGMDVLIFTAGIGENSPTIRATICSGLEVLGVYLDIDKNQSLRGEGIISAPYSRVKVIVFQTNEDFIVARESKTVIVKNNPTIA